MINGNGLMMSPENLKVHPQRNGLKTITRKLTQKKFTAGLKHQGTSTMLSNLINSQHVYCNCALYSTRNSIPTECPEILEIIESITSLKNNKSPVLDNISREQLKAAPETSSHILPEEFWRTNQLRDELKEGLIINILTKGDLSQCKSWRGIKLKNVAKNILSQIINKRLTTAFDPEL